MKHISLGTFGVAVGLLVAFSGYVIVRNRPLPQNEYDVRILERTLELLGSENQWSKEDDRHCDPTAAKLSLYCALRQASIEIAGEFHHRAAALQAVRRAIDEMYPDNNYEHRIRDFNNAPGVTLGAVHGLLRRSMDELRNENSKRN